MNFELIIFDLIPKRGKSTKVFLFFLNRNYRISEYCCEHEDTEQYGEERNFYIRKLHNQLSNPSLVILLYYRHVRNDKNHCKESVLFHIRLQIHRSKLLRLYFDPYVKQCGENRLSIYGSNTITIPSSVDILTRTPIFAF